MLDSPPPRKPEKAPASTPAATRPEASGVCRRCYKPIEREERETFFRRTGLCFWCAYVDSQG